MASKLAFAAAGAAFFWRRSSLNWPVIFAVGGTNDSMTAGHEESWLTVSIVVVGDFLRQGYSCGLELAGVDVMKPSGPTAASRGAENALSRNGPCK